MTGACSVAGCDRPVLQRGFCNPHLLRWRRYGDPTAGRIPHGAARQWIEDHVSYSGDDCLIWPFATHNGYGVARIGGKTAIVSRYMCEAVNGEAPDDKPEAAHNCGNGAHGCVNPRHMRWATHKDNHGDRIRLGTILNGEDIHGAKLTARDAEDILRLSRSTTLTHQAIASRYGVGRRTIGRLIAGETWRHVRANVSANKDLSHVMDEGDPEFPDEEPAAVAAE